jgi:hypothetical protein
MVARALFALGLALAVGLAGSAASAAPKRQPYELPRLTPRYPPGAMSRSEPWKLKEPNAYAIRQPPYPYASKQARAHVASQVRAYHRSFKGYTPPKSPRMRRQPRINGVCYVSNCR